MIFQYDWEPVLNQRILIGFKALLENIFKYKSKSLNVKAIFKIVFNWLSMGQSVRREFVRGEKFAIGIIANIQIRVDKSYYIK